METTTRPTDPACPRWTAAECDAAGGHRTCPVHGVAPGFKRGRDVVEGDVVLNPFGKVVPWLADSRWTVEFRAGVLVAVDPGNYERYLEVEPSVHHRVEGAP
jgi:hypothetical protein